MRYLAGLLCALWCVTGVGANEPQSFSPEDLEFFEKQVRPLLVDRCHKCHGPEEQKGKLRLDSRAGVLAGGESGPAVIPGKPAESELIRAVSYDPAGYQMPPDGKLPEAEIAILRRWVERGVPWPPESDAAAGPSVSNWTEEFERRRRHWSFQPLVRPPVPDVQDAGWCRNPIDRFLLARQEAAGLPHADEADRRTWLRRVSFDVLGLAPTPAEIAAFLQDEAAGAQERVIDRLLASPHFGERWGRHWLDLVRYAESRGHEFDYDVPNPWHYRDYVIRAFNDDVPYNRFVVEHVAGDLLKVESPVSREEQDRHSSHLPPGGLPAALNSARLDPVTGANLSIVATGFWFFGEWVHSPVDIRQEEADRFENMIDVYSKTFLGLTVACARCHDHKFDPIPQSDFYALQGYLQSSSYHQVRFETQAQERVVADKLADLERQAVRELLPLYAEAAAPTVERLDHHLLAAVEALRAAAAGLDRSSRQLPQPVLDRAEQLASERKLDSRTLRNWIEHLGQAADDPRDPFHLWGQLATGRLTDVAALQARLAGAVTPEEEVAWYEQALAEGRVLDLKAFRADGAAFLPRPAAEATALLTTDAEQPLSRIEEGGFIEYLPELGELPLATGVMHDPGKLAPLQRGGRTLRTPTFEITAHKICCEIRGGCHTYVVVDSHALINGPLHGSLVKEHPQPPQGGDEWRWIEHDVSRYQGHRAHLEFIPRRGEPFAVREVLLADSLPPQGAFQPDLGPWVTFPPPASPEALAQCYRDRWRTIPVCIGWYLSPGRSGVCDLETTEWARRHPQLFGLDALAARQRFAKVAAPLIEKRVALLKQLQSGSALAPVMLDGSGEDEYLFIRGNWKKRGDVIPRRFLSAFLPADGPIFTPADGIVFTPADGIGGSPHGSGRLELALQMVDPRQTPILPRVIVNRIWQHYFGRGLVPTPDDFGHLGLPPTHPELLDWLACELVDHGWSLKHIHRLILTSSAYRMASEWRVEHGAEGDEQPQLTVAGELATPGAPLAQDPGNSLLWRMNVKRLEGEIIRDALLQLSGRLDATLYGPSVPVHLTSFLEGRGRPGESGPVDGRGRRSLYIAVRRNFPEPFFQAFDFPNPHSCIGRRNVSNVPAQALALMNNPLVLEQAQLCGRRLYSDVPGDVAARITRLYELAFSRPPTEDERRAAAEFLAAQAAELGVETDDPRVWADYVHVLVNAKEFIFLR